VSGLAFVARPEEPCLTIAGATVAFGGAGWVLVARRFRRSLIEACGWPARLQGLVFALAALGSLLLMALAVQTLSPHL
jgi:hypothetical protein